MTFISERFLLHNDAALSLYRNYGSAQPIIDYHCHLSPKDIAENRQFNNLFEIWLAGDHYKWRAMRANGVPEAYCTGDAGDYDKFLAWAKTVPQTLRNPLYHWSRLELNRYFGVGEDLNEHSAAAIWDRANAVLNNGLTAQAILRKFNVEVVCTTDDPAESLEYHDVIARQQLPTQVFPTFRPDRVFLTQDVPSFNAWIEKLGAVADVHITRLADLLDALRKRHDAFHQRGCRASDHGLEVCFADFCTEREAARLFALLRGGKSISQRDSSKFSAFILLYTAQLDAEKGWVKQLHLGALRNANRSSFTRLGPDTGFDSIGDKRQAEPLAAFLSRLLEENALPKIILYNANPADNYVFATMAGNFQDGSFAGKIQYGTAWWFLDQKEGMEWQLNALSNSGLLSRFIGMTTDSRSWMSYPRHEYFRRILCNVLGREMEAGELPPDEAAVGAMVKRVCYHNAKEYFGFPSSTQSGAAAHGKLQFGAVRSP